VILRADGVPTYNFGVVVDDIDMQITHVIRGDDHVNNTPRQINVYDALGAPVPKFGHVPMILGPDGERLSKRHGAVSVMQYPEDGYLPEAMLNYLARLGWSHGDDEVFSLEQFVDWFDLEHINRSPAQFNPEKLQWLNQQYLKHADPNRLAEAIAPRVAREGGDLARGPALAEAAALLRERATTLNELAGGFAERLRRVAHADGVALRVDEPLGREGEREAAEAEMAAANASLAQAAWRLEQKSVAAPMAALVQDTFFVEGEWVPAGRPVASLLPPGNVKVRFYVPETVLGSIQTGKQLEVRCDGCPQAIAARVTYISSQAEYTPPVLYTREQRVKLMYLIEARPDPARAAGLRPGQPVDLRLK